MLPYNVTCLSEFEGKTVKEEKSPTPREKWRPGYHLDRFTSENKGQCAIPWRHYQSAPSMSRDLRPTVPTFPFSLLSDAIDFVSQSKELGSKRLSIYPSFLVKIYLLREQCPRVNIWTHEGSQWR